MLKKALELGWSLHKASIQFFKPPANDLEEWNSVQVRVDEDLPTRSPLARYQESVAKPKNWEASLPRWEREVVDDFNKSAPSNQNDTQVRRDEDCRGLANPAPSVPIYQLPKYEKNASTYKMLANKGIAPIQIDSRLIEGMKKTAEIIFHDQVGSFVELWRYPKEVIRANMEYTKTHLDPLNPMESISHIVLMELSM